MTRPRVDLTKPANEEREIYARALRKSRGAQEVLTFFTDINIWLILQSLFVDIIILLNSIVEDATEYLNVSAWSPFGGWHWWIRGVMYQYYLTSICLVAILDPRLKAATYLTNIYGMAMSETQLIFPNLLAIICWVIIYLTVMSQYLIVVRCSDTSQHCLPTFSVFMVLCFRPFLLKKIVFPLMPSSPFIQILHLLVFSL